MTLYSFFESVAKLGYYFIFAAQLFTNMRKLLLTIVLLLTTYTGFATRYYVNAAATGANTGLSWTNAFVNLQSALSVVMPGDEIWVAAGVYKPSATDNRSTSFVMKNGVNVYGGFNGTETTMDQRNIASAPTTLSGDIGEPGTNNDNTYSILKIQNFSSTFVLDGFIISNGYNGTASGAGAGAYINSNSGANITIKNCVFYNNYAYHSGGGLYIRSTNIIFENCDFLYNSSYNYGGGAIYAANGSNATIKLLGCKFTGNSTRDGAAINFDGTSLIFDRCIISSNTASTGSIISVNDADAFKIYNTLIVGNLLTSNSGSTVVESYTTSSVSSLVNVTICHNRNSSTLPVSTPPVYNANGIMYIHNSIIYGNSTTSQNYQVDTGNNVKNCILQGTYPASPTNNVNNLFVEPQFVAPATLAAAPFDASNYNYSLQQVSGGVNSGDNALVNVNYNLDINGLARIQGGTVDRGAYESGILSVGYPETLKDEVIFNNKESTLSFGHVNKYIGSEFKIYDLNGKNVMKAVIEQNVIKINLPSGLYILKIDNKSKKIMVL